MAASPSMLSCITQATKILVTQRPATGETLCTLLARRVSVKVWVGPEKVVDAIMSVLDSTSGLYKALARWLVFFEESLAFRRSTADTPNVSADAMAKYALRWANGLQSIKSEWECMSLGAQLKWLSDVAFVKLTVDPAEIVLELERRSIITKKGFETKLIYNDSELQDRSKSEVTQDVANSLHVALPFEKVSINLGNRNRAKLLKAKLGDPAAAGMRWCRRAADVCNIDIEQVRCKHISAQVPTLKTGRLGEAAKRKNMTVEERQKKIREFEVANLRGQLKATEERYMAMPSVHKIERITHLMTYCRHFLSDAEAGKHGHEEQKDGTKPIKHNVDAITSFDMLRLPIPITVSEIPPLLKQLEDLWSEQDAKIAKECRAMDTKIKELKSSLKELEDSNADKKDDAYHSQFTLEMILSTKKATEFVQALHAEAAKEFEDIVGSPLCFSPCAFPANTKSRVACEQCIGNRLRSVVEMDPKRSTLFLWPHCCGSLPSDEFTCVKAIVMTMFGFKAPVRIVHLLSEKRQESSRELDAFKAAAYKHNLRLQLHPSTNGQVQVSAWPTPWALIQEASFVDTLSKLEDAVRRAQQALQTIAARLTDTLNVEPTPPIYGEDEVMYEMDKTNDCATEVVAQANKGNESSQVKWERNKAAKEKRALEHKLPGSDDTENRARLATRSVVKSQIRHEKERHRDVARRRERDVKYATSIDLIETSTTLSPIQQHDVNVGDPGPRSSTTRPFQQKNETGHQEVTPETRRTDCCYTDAAKGSRNTVCLEVASATTGEHLGNIFAVQEDCIGRLKKAFEICVHVPSWRQQLLVEESFEPLQASALVMDTSLALGGRVLLVIEPWTLLCRCLWHTDAFPQWTMPISDVQKLAQDATSVRIHQNSNPIASVTSRPGSYPIEDLRNGQAIGSGRELTRDEVQNTWDSEFPELLECLWHKSAEIRPLKHTVYCTTKNPHGLHWGDYGPTAIGAFPRHRCGWTIPRAGCRSEVLLPNRFQSCKCEHVGPLELYINT